MVVEGASWEEGRELIRRSSQSELSSAEGTVVRNTVAPSTRAQNRSAAVAASDEQCRSHTSVAHALHNKKHEKTRKSRSLGSKTFGRATAEASIATQAF